MLLDVCLTLEHCSQHPSPHFGLGIAKIGTKLISQTLVSDSEPNHGTESGLVVSACMVQGQLGMRVDHLLPNSIRLDAAQNRLPVNRMVALLFIR